MRNNIRVITCNLNKANTLNNARKKAFDKLFRNEKYVIMTKSILFCKHWDEALCTQFSKVPNSSILTSHITNNNSFACIRKVTANYKLELEHCNMMNTIHNQPIEALLWDPNFTFTTSDTAKLLCEQDGCILSVSTVLDENDIYLYYPEKTIGIRDMHPAGLRQSTKPSIPTKRLEEYLRKIGVQDQQINKHAWYGLTHKAGLQECIAKYGSVKNAKFYLNDS
jgi:hypothetical protein